MISYLIFALAQVAIFFTSWYTHQGVAGSRCTALLSAWTTFFPFWKPRFLNGFFDLPGNCQISGSNPGPSD